MRKIYLLVFFGALLLFACATTQDDVAATPLPAVTVPAAASLPTASSKLIPKHNDLIFVEFFAVT